MKAEIIIFPKQSAHNCLVTFTTNGRWGTKLFLMPSAYQEFFLAKLEACDEVMLEKSVQFTGFFFFKSKHMNKSMNKCQVSRKLEVAVVVLNCHS